MIFDSHAHYDDQAFDQDRDDILRKVEESGIGHIVNAGTNIESSRLSVHLADEHGFVYAAVGIHPEDAGEFNGNSIKLLTELAGNSKVVAIGEIGLDYYHENTDGDIQEMVFDEQLRLAVDLKLPVIIHDRDAHKDTLDIIKRYGKKGLKGVMHCYSGSADMAKEYIGMGFYIGFTGVITFKNAKKSIEVLEQIPLDRILIETDCPYLAPVPFRGKRNDSSYLYEVVRKACEILNVEQDYFISMTCSNAQELFNIKK